MKYSLPALIALLLLVGMAQGAEPVAKRYLINLFSTKGDDLAKICHPTDDLWMLGGLDVEDALTALKALEIEQKQTGVVSAHFGNNLIFVETRNGKVDPSFNLETEYQAQKTVVKQFIAATLTRDEEMIRALVVDPGNVQIDGPTAALGDMDVYYMVIAAMPIVRASKPSEDAQSRTITYRMPIGNEVERFTLTKADGRWKIATTKKVRVPLQWFFQSARANNVTPIYDIELENRTGQMIANADVRFDDRSWGFTFGYMKGGVSGAYAGIGGMPPIPESATVKWTNEAGDKKSRVKVSIPENIRAMSNQPGELRFVIKDGETVEVEFVKD